MRYPVWLGRELLFKIDGTTLHSSGGGKVYSINMISENQNTIKQLKSADGSEFEGYNSDSDLDLVFDAPAAVESNVSPASPDNDDVQTPHETPTKRLLEDDLFTPDAATST